MCDNQYINYWWQNSFYHQYMQQHAAIAQWMQNLHSNVDMQDFHNVSHPCQCNAYCPKSVHYHNKPTEYNPSNESSSTPSENRSSSPYSTTDSGIKERESLETPEDDEDESEFELELNVDAILAMRKAKEELKKEESSESSSIVMIDNGKEDFEFVELGSTREMDSKRAVLAGGMRDRQAELQYEKEFKEHLYGEKFTTIAGLETAMSLTYERLCDIHQPPVWPVYPLRLTSRV